MSEEQLRLMAQVVIGLCRATDIYVPYDLRGVNVGQCRACGVVGVLHYTDLFYDHKPECLTMKAKQLALSLE